MTEICPTYHTNYHYQTEMLPEKSVDLFINISSLHEMKTDKIQAYFKLIEKLTNGFYLYQTMVD